MKKHVRNLLLIGTAIGIIAVVSVTAVLVTTYNTTPKEGMDIANCVDNGPVPLTVDIMTCRILRMSANGALPRKVSEEQARNLMTEVFTLGKATKTEISEPELLKQLEVVQALSKDTLGVDLEDFMAMPYIPRSRSQIDVANCIDDGPPPLTTDIMVCRVLRLSAAGAFPQSISEDEARQFLTEYADFANFYQTYEDGGIPENVMQKRLTETEQLCLNLLGITCKEFHRLPYPPEIK